MFKNMGTKRRANFIFLLFKIFYQKLLIYDTSTVVSFRYLDGPVLQHWNLRNMRPPPPNKKYLLTNQRFFQTIFVNFNETKYYEYLNH